MDTQKRDDLILGIDIGTTSVKVVVIDNETKTIITSANKDTQANIPSELGREGHKQSVPKILAALNACVAKLHKRELRRVTKIGVCGQMHGVMLWNNNNNDNRNAWDCIRRDDGMLIRFDVPAEHVSALYTWQDSRCDSAFLDSLPVPDSHLPVHSGYGCATLFWMARNRPEKLERFNCAGTVQDFVVAMLCDLRRPIMSVQNAASWGYFNCSAQEWNRDVLSSSGFPTGLLPTVQNSGQIVGRLSESWHCIPGGTPIGVALGDLQCSVLATISEPNHDLNTMDSDSAVLNISTSAQLTFVVPHLSATAAVNHVEYFPYFQHKYLTVAASLNGGNVLAAFVQMLQQWNIELGFSVPQSTIWEKVIALGLECTETETLMSVEPTLFGERNSTIQNASVRNIHMGNLGLGHVFKALCHGLIENIYRMMPKDYLLQHNIKRILGNGSGLSRNKLLQNQIQTLYEMPLVFSGVGDAAKGAALAQLLDN